MMSNITNQEISDIHVNKEKVHAVMDTEGVVNNDEEH